MKKLVVSTSPHINQPITIRRIMLDVLIALIPAGLMSIYLFGLYAIKNIVIAVMSCWITEAVSQKMMKREITTNDLSAVVTGLLFAYTLPPGIPGWMVMIGGIFCIFIGKQVFGGLGHNPFNPALAGRAFLQISWPSEMSSWMNPFEFTTTATPLTITKLKLAEIKINYTQLFIGNHSGSLGETSILLLLVGFIYLLIRGHVTLHTPIFYIASFALIIFVSGGDVLFHLLTGGLFLGALFMATDPVTTPLTYSGKVIFGIGCGLLTALIRLKGGYPEGVCFSILIMNMFTPIIDRLRMPRRFGTS